MRTYDLVDFAVTLADHFESIVAAGQRLDEHQLQDYWTTSRARLNTWGGKLRRGTNQLNITEYRSETLWKMWSPLLEEVLASDVVTRIWAAILQSLDDRLGLHEYSPIGRSVMLGHQDARGRVVNMMLRGKRAESPAAQRLDGLRAALERWTDLLLAHASRDLRNAQYCHDETRFAHFVAVYEEGLSSRLSFVRSAATLSLEESATVTPSHVEFHERMQRQMLGALRQELFLPSTGLMQSSWQARMVSLADDVQAMLDRCFSESDPNRQGTSPNLPRRTGPGT